MAALTADYDNANEINQVLNHIYGKTMVSTFTIFLPIFLTSVALELKWNVTYAIGVGYLLAIGLYFWYNLRAQATVRQKPLFAKFDDTTWYILLQSVKLRYSPLLDKLGIAFLFLIGPAILVITYFVNH